MALRNREVRDRSVRRKVDAKARKQRFHQLIQPLAVDELEGSAIERLTPHEDVRGSIQIIEKIEFLMHEGDARLKGFLNAQRHAFDTVDPEMARRRREQPTEDFHQSRFTGAILADEPDHFAWNLPKSLRGPAQ